MLHLRALGQRESILDIDAKVADGALDLRMSEWTRVMMRISLSH